MELLFRQLLVQPSVLAAMMVDLPYSQSAHSIFIPITNYQLPNGLIKVRRRWGQRHPQGANSGSNGKLKLMPNSKWLPPAHP
jgi:hypothetical protein